MIDQMHSYLRKFFIVTAATILLSAQVLPQNVTRKPLVPMEPEDLIKLLPAAPKDWTMTQSTANNYFIGWLCCQASREFQHPPQPVPLSQTTPQPQITKVRLMDTGYFPTFNGDFENFRVGKYAGAETLVIDGMPARKFLSGPNHERLRVSVRGRYIVEVETENQPANSCQAWLKIVDFQKISSLPDSTPATLPKPIRIKKIDEMNPKNNSSSDLHWSGPVKGDTDH